MKLRNLVKQAARVSGSPSILGLVVALSMQIFSGSAHSQTSYPNRPVTLVVPVPPGGILDTVARMVMPSMAQTLGQPVVIDNKAGASGNIAASFVARDGLRATWAYRSLVARNLVMDFIEQQTTEVA